MTWASAADVLSVTGTTVDSAAVAQAHAVVEVYAGIPATTTDLNARNLRLLNRAVCFQAAWVVAQVDVLSRVEVTTITQDGASVTPATPDALLLAPLAQRCLAQLSWRRAGSVRVNRAQDVPVYATIAAAESAFLRDEMAGEWRPLT
jgi:hypothetical protein